MDTEKYAVDSISLLILSTVARIRA